MRIHGVWFVAFGATLIVSMGACGGDDDDSSAGSSGMQGSGGAEQNVPCDASKDGTCTNETDCPMVITGKIRESAQTCGVGCLQDTDPGMCSVSCIVQDTGATPACSACYAALIGCAAQNCLGQCGSDPKSSACTQCQIEKGCRTQFDSCSGLTTN